MSACDSESVPTSLNTHTHANTHTHTHTNTHTHTQRDTHTHTLGLTGKERQAHGVNTLRAAETSLCQCLASACFASQEPRQNAETHSHPRLRMNNTLERWSARVVEFDGEFAISESLAAADTKPQATARTGVLTAAFCERVSGCSLAWLPEGVRARPRTRRHFTDRLRSTHREIQSCWGRG